MNEKTLLQYRVNLLFSTSFHLIIFMKWQDKTLVRETEDRCRFAQVLDLQIDSFGSQVINFYFYHCLYSGATWKRGMQSVTQ